MTTSRVLVLAIGCACILPLAMGASLPVLGDAGMPADAGDDRASATPLETGAYEGNLTPGDADWYALAGLKAPGCLDVTAMTKHAMRFTIAHGDSEITAAPHEGLFGSTLAVGPGAVHFAALSDDEPWSLASVGPYSFGLALSAAWASGDQRGLDAPSSIALAGPVPDECFRAVFRHDGPDADAWTFQARELDVITYSFAVGPAATGVLEIVAPDGATLAAASTGDIGQLVVPATGSYAVRATSLTSTDNAEYVIGLALGPDPSGCRPYCLASE